jgi:hypothetical protein
MRLQPLAEACSLRRRAQLLLLYKNQSQLVQVIAVYTLVSAVGSSNSKVGVGLCADVGLCVLDVPYQSHMRSVLILSVLILTYAKCA